MILPFRKMHGAGNDFIIVDARAHPLALSPAQIAALSHRRTGIGCDQFITLEPPDPGADVFMRIHNPDGSEAGACGNATRCVAAMLHEQHPQSTYTIQTISGLLPVAIGPQGIEVDMGVPKLRWNDVPLAGPTDTLHLPIEGDPAALSMGNPHATLFVTNVDQAATRGAALERHPIFPDRANIGFAHIEAPDRIRLRVWERGAGLTLACGSGACAALVNAHRRGLTGRAATLLLDGGTLHIAWREDGHVIMTGPATTVFHGTVFHSAGDLTTTPS